MGWDLKVKNRTEMNEQNNNELQQVDAYDRHLSSEPSFHYWN